MLYMLALRTGLRRRELLTLMPRSFKSSRAVVRPAISIHATRRLRSQRCFRNGWRRTPTLAGAGRGSLATECCDAEKLDFDDYSEFC